MEDKKPKYIEGVGWRYETEHSMQRRMAGHDYKSRCIYMITICTEGRVPLFGTLRWTHGHAEDAHVERTPLGEEVARCWAGISSHYHGVGALSIMVMPDHVHGLLFVQKEQEVHIGQMINGFKVGCNKAYRRLVLGRVECSETMPQKTEQRPKHSEYGMLFAPGYQDSILMGRGQLECMWNYMRQNPYRLDMKRECPDLFRVVRELKVGDVTFAAIGNRWLLDRPMRMQVRCHNNQSPDNLRLIQMQKAYFHMKLCRHFQGSDI